MKNCPECGKEFPESENFCPNCGKYVPALKTAFEHEEQPEENSGYTVENPEFEHEKEDGLRAAFDENITGNENKKDLSTPSVWSFVLTLFLCSIPVVGLIHLIVLAFGGTKYEAKKNYARAVFLYMFIMAVVSSAITVILIFFFGDSVADYLRYFTEIAGNF